MSVRCRESTTRLPTSSQCAPRSHSAAAAIVIPPRANAVEPSDDSPPGQRDQHIAAISRDGRIKWQVSNGYGKRSLVETAVGRYKSIIGPRLRARLLPAQQTEAAIGCADIVWQHLSGGRCDRRPSLHCLFAYRFHIGRLALRGCFGNVEDLSRPNAVGVADLRSVGEIDGGIAYATAVDAVRNPPQRVAPPDNHGVLDTLEFRGKLFGRGCATFFHCCALRNGCWHRGVGRRRGNGSNGFPELTLERYRGVRNHLDAIRPENLDTDNMIANGHVTLGFYQEASGGGRFGVAEQNIIDIGANSSVGIRNTCQENLPPLNLHCFNRGLKVANGRCGRRSN